MLTSLVEKKPLRPATGDLDAEFNAYVIDLWHRLVRITPRGPRERYAERLSHCDAEWWLSRARLRKRSGQGFTMPVFMFVVSHNKVRALPGMNLNWKPTQS
jgi:hypothetical protein